jgi:hypothetical protein
MHRFAKSIVIGLLGAVLTFVPASAWTTSYSSVAGTTCGVWSQVASPNSGGSDNTLGGVAATSASDAWAVGSFAPNSKTGFTLTLAEHWDGVSWKIVSTPNVGSLSNSLFAVAALASNDAWAVGNYIGSDHIAHTLIENWNGTGWSIVPSPDGGPGNNVLTGVAGASTDDVWAVGQSRSASGSFQTLTEHWNGSNWQVVSSPNAGTSDNVLNGVVALASNDVWAAGEALGPASPDQALLLHWAGSAWSVVQTPSLSNTGVFYAIGGAAGSVTGVGDVFPIVGAPTQTLVEQSTNGQPFAVATSPNDTTTDNLFYGVSVISPTNAWAVGQYLDASGNPITLTEQWNGTSWNIVASPDPGVGGNILAAVAATSANDVWAVGATAGSGTGADRTLILHYC